MFGGGTYAQYTLLIEGVGQVRQRRQGNLRSTISEELSIRFRTENENGLLLHMSGSGTNGDSASIQVSITTRARQMHIILLSKNDHNSYFVPSVGGWLSRIPH